MASLDTIGGIHYEMIKRCYNENSVAYKTYGAVGIKVCDEWLDRNNFRSWCMENGWEKGLRVVRIDSKKDYSPDNCYICDKYVKRENGGASLRERARANREKKATIEGYDNVKHRLRSIYSSMHQRCENEKSFGYRNYGLRGVSVCEEWSGKDGFFNFVLWATKNGYSELLTLDRIDVNGNYEPKNCRWATRLEQGRNKRNNKRFNYNGTMLTIAEISEKECVSINKLTYSLIKKKLTIEEFLNNSSAQKKSCKA